MLIIIDATAQKLCYLVDPNTASRKTVMTPSAERVSAKIYQFPVDAVRARAQQAAALQANRASQAACDPCWYHDEAVRDAETRPRD